MSRFPFRMLRILCLPVAGLSVLWFAGYRDAADPEGKSSRFSLKDVELSEDLDSHDAVAKLVVMIEGKSYSGRISHDHDADHSQEDGHTHQEPVWIPQNREPKDAHANLGSRVRTTNTKAARHPAG